MSSTDGSQSASLSIFDYEYDSDSELVTRHSSLSLPPRPKAGSIGLTAINNRGIAKNFCSTIMNSGYRQEVFNVLLAQLLQERGIIAAPEKVLRVSPTSNRRMPDVMVISFQGLRTTIEGEVDDQPNAREKALSSVTKRVEDGIAHIGLAVIYPAYLRKVVFSTLKTSLEACELSIAVVTESEKTDFITGDVNYLENSLRRAFEHLVQEDIVAKAVSALEAGIEKFAGELATRTGDVGRVADALGIRGLESANKADTGDES